MILSAWLALLSAASSCVIPVEVSTQAGEIRRGTFAGVSPDGIRLDRDGQLSVVPTETLDQLVPGEVEQRPPLKIRVLLWGGSEISVRSVDWSDGALVVKPPRQSRLRIPIKQVRAIRFRASSPRSDTKWLGVLEEESRRDKLVIHRESGTLDTTSGIIESLADGKVQFNLDGTPIAAPIEKLEGIVFGNATDRVAASGITLIDTYGSTWAVTELVASEQRDVVRIRVDQLVHKIPIEIISSIRWSSGVTLLASAQPAASDIRPAISTRLDKGLFEKFFAAETFDDDLVLLGGTRLEYRIDPDIRVFKGAVRRESSVKWVTGVAVKVWLDDEIVWQQMLDDAQAKGFELDVAGARRLKLEIDSGNDGDLGAKVRLTRPRLLK